MNQRQFVVSSEDGTKIYSYHYPSAAICEFSILVKNGVAEVSLPGTGVKALIMSEGDLMRFTLA
jgi:hypothetical protein